MAQTWKPQRQFGGQPVIRREIQRLTPFRGFAMQSAVGANLRADGASGHTFAFPQADCKCSTIVLRRGDDDRVPFDQVGDQCSERRVNSANAGSRADDGRDVDQNTQLAC